MYIYMYGYAYMKNMYGYMYITNKFAWCPKCSHAPCAYFHAARTSKLP